MNATIKENKKYNGIELYFESFPYAATRNILKGAGFKWHNLKKCWYAVDTKERREVATKVVNREKDHAPYIFQEKPEKAAVNQEPAADHQEPEKEPEKVYKYGMRLRGFSIGCQPKEGFIERLDDTTGRYYDIIAYNRALSADEINHYSLDLLEDIEPEKEPTPEPEKNSLNIELEKPAKKARRSDTQKAFDYIVKQAPDHMKTTDHGGAWCGTFEGITYGCDGHQLLITTDPIEYGAIEKADADKMQKMYKEAIKAAEKNIELDFTAKELKAGMQQLKAGKRSVKVAYTTENGITLNAEFLYNMMIATGSNLIKYSGPKNPVFMEGEKTQYMLCPINGKEAPAGLHIIA